MSTRTICDNCQQEIKTETGFALWRQDTDTKEADLLAEKTQGDAVYYLSSILRQMREFQEIMTTSESFYGPTLSSEIMADNMDWLDCFIDAITKNRAALATPAAQEKK